LFCPFGTKIIKFELCNYAIIPDKYQGWLPIKLEAEITLDFSKKISPMVIKEFFGTGGFCSGSRFELPFERQSPFFFVAKAFYLRGRRPRQNKSPFNFPPSRFQHFCPCITTRFFAEANSRALVGWQLGGL